MTNYTVATIKTWNIDAYARHSKALPGEWRLVTEPAQLTRAFLAGHNPRYVFFPHWSERVPAEILNNFECVCFHMTDVPYGRGGSPLQNLIARGHNDTVITALRMTESLDAGPIYLKSPLSLSGRAQDIFERAADLVYDMIREIVTKEPVPVPQAGEPVIFKRRRPEMSQLPDRGQTQTLYDHIRMLDAETYPKAFIDHGDFRLTFEDADLQTDGTLKVRVTIGKKP
jgi:methionyl-tRNA formyltransferase